MNFKAISAWLFSALVSIMAFLFFQVNIRISNIEEKLNDIENKVIINSDNIREIEKELIKIQ